MNSVWVVVVNRSVYGVAEDRLTAYLMLKTYVRTLSGTPRALAKNILEASYNSGNLNSIGINADTYAEVYHVTEVDEV
jgi:hypothetical protein